VLLGGLVFQVWCRESQRIPVDPTGPFRVLFRAVSSDHDHWNELLRAARDEVARVVEALPDDLRRHAQEVPVTYESYPSEALLGDGWDPDLLGMFVGDPIGEPATSGVPLQILLFLENLWDFADEAPDVFLEEVRVTYIHEFGHYLGLDEEQLQERGLL
jgi:predicted Zn-dependent protease with MMP-like domain